MKGEQDMEIRWIDEDAPGMRLHRRFDCLWLTFPAFDELPWLKNAFSTRFGGVSGGYFASMNLDYKGSDDPEAVKTNFSRFAEAAGFRTDEMVFSDQTHTVNVRRVGRGDRGAGLTKPLPWRDVDGLITDEPGVTLVTFYADCVPLYFVDQVRHAIGLAHAGWRGTAAGMGRSVIEAMKREFGTEPEDLLCAVGPSICQSCYEVGREVAEQFPNCYSEPNARGRFQLDLQGANQGVMAEAGVPVSRISRPGLCTCCNPDLLFSHRATGGKRGEMAAFLSMV